MSARLKDHYEKVVKANLKKEFSYKNDLEIPKIEKIVINMGVGEATQDKKKLQSAVNEITIIAGQKPIITKAIHTSGTTIARIDMEEAKNNSPVDTKKLPNPPVAPVEPALIAAVPP